MRPWERKHVCGKAIPRCVNIIYSTRNALDLRIASRNEPGPESAVVSRNPQSRAGVRCGFPFAPSLRPTRG